MPLVGKIISCCALSATSILLIINFKTPEVPKESEVESIHTEVTELDAEDSSVSHRVEEKKGEVKEESAQGSIEVATTTKTNTQPKISTSTKAQTTAKPTAQATTNQATAQTTQKRYTSVYDFEHAMLGVCPQNVPSGVWPDKLRPIVSLGYRPEERYGASSTETAVAIWWSGYKQGITSPSYIANVIGGNQIGGDCGQGTDDTMFKMNYNTLTVYWEDGSITPSGKTWADNKAQYMTSFLRNINSQFKAKCGY